MSLTTSEMTPADIAAVTGNNGGNNGWGGDGGWFWIVILFLFAAAGNGFGNGFGGFGGGGAGAQANYVLASDFATIQRQLSDGFNGIGNHLDHISNGLCDGFYTQAQLINGVNMNIMQTGYGLNNAINTLGYNLKDCCCELNYNLATQANGISRDLERGFCDAGYRDAMNTNNLIQSGRADADRIIAKLDAMENARKDEKIAEQNQLIFDLRLKASQEAQNNYLVSQLGYQCPKPAYVVSPPKTVNFPVDCCGNVAFANPGCGF